MIQPSKMLYSRHFYRNDEVKAALQYEVHRTRVYDSLFWLTELIDSEEFQDIQRVLLKSWFYDVGLGNIDLLYHILITPSHDITTIYQIVNTLCYSKRDSTLPIMFVYGISNNTYKNKNIMFKLPDALIVDDKKIDAFIRACFLGKYLEAWNLSISLWNIPNFQLYIERVIKYKFKNSIFLIIINFLKHTKSINIWIIRCIIVALCCYTEKLYVKNDALKEVDIDIKIKLKVLEKLLGKRKRRELAIPKECLYGITFRGTRTYDQTNIYELYDPENLLMNQKISEEIMDQYQSYDNFKSNDDEYESFMDVYFPDDIPDEWSLIDQQKSHGIGVNQKGDIPLIRRYFNRWVDLKSDCKIWDKETIVTNILQNLQNSFKSFYIENEILEKYDEKAKSNISDAWDMKNMKLLLSTLEEE